MNSTSVNEITTQVHSSVLDQIQAVAHGIGAFFVAEWVLGILAVIPIWLILRRMGLNPALSLLYLVPILGPLATWVLAFVPWPNLRHGGQSAITGDRNPSLPRV
jgi:hypothetical protein